MAGLIAGKDAGLSAPYSDAPASAYRGMAPDARIVSVKVGVADGGVDVSQVIAAIDWVVQHRNDNDLNIRVINLSYGTNSAQLSTIDPLAYAAEQAWKAGILVVAAGGNYGFQSHMNNAPALADPAVDRYLMAVGSSDSEGTMTVARRHGAGLLTVAEAWRDARRRPDRPGRAPAGAARPEQLQRPQPSGRPDRQPLLPRQRDVRVGGHRVRRRGAALPDVPDREAGPGSRSC